MFYPGVINHRRYDGKYTNIYVQYKGENENKKGYALTGSWDCSK